MYVVSNYAGLGHMYIGLNSSDSDSVLCMSV